MVESKAQTYKRTDIENREQKVLTDPGMNNKINMKRILSSFSNKFIQESHDITEIILVINAMKNHHPQIHRNLFSCNFCYLVCRLVQYK